ncbi:MAG: site-2 protease family protein [Phototrophicales bacterium]
MLHEPASSYNDDRPLVAHRVEPYEEKDTFYSEIRAAIETIFIIEEEEFAINATTTQHRRNLLLISPESRLLMTFKGKLKLDSEQAYNQLDDLFRQRDLLPIFRSEPINEKETRHIIYVVQGRVKPNSGGVWLSFILFVLTIFSVLFVGTIMAINEIGSTNPFLARQLFNNVAGELWRGMPYAASILLILGAHELGHYFAARYHRTAASLPYFLPFPFGIFGTFGAAIRLREPMRNRKVLLDIGAAGPLAGLVFAIPILLIGLATSPVRPIEPGLVEGNSILYAVSKFVVFGEFLPNGSRDVFVNQMAWAGWTGLLVTGLNLIPVGQLDGGHILYSLLGRVASTLFYPIAAILVLMTFTIANELLVFVILILLMGNLHAVPLDDITPLDSRRRGIAIFALIVFVLVFVPMPLQEATIGGAPIPDLPDDGYIMLPIALIYLWQRFRV